MDDCDPLPENDWCDRLYARLAQEYWGDLKRWLKESGASFYPPPMDVFRALELTWFRDTKIVIVGQDPYPSGQADGLCFSVRPGFSIPLSLGNIRKELCTDQKDAEIPKHGSLEGWAREGVLLLNAALTVSPGKAGSHRKRWREFTDEVIKVLSHTKLDRVVFILWGCDAQKKEQLIDESRHTIIRSSHPSPLAARRPCRGSPPFVGSRPFSKANEALRDSGQEPIDWSLT